MTTFFTYEQMNEDVVKWLGRCYHEIEFIPLGPEEFPYCKHCRRQDISWHWEYPDGHCVRIPDDRPDFSKGTGIILLLKEMMKREDWKLFADMIIGVRVLNHHYVHTDYIIEEGALLKAVWEWSRRQDVPSHNIGDGEYRPTGDKLVLKRRENNAI